MPTFDISLDFEAFCARCGAGICNNVNEGRTTGRGMHYIRVEPCENCLDTQYNKGHADGYAEAEEDQRHSPRGN